MNAVQMRNAGFLNGAWIADFSLSISRGCLDVTTFDSPFALFDKTLFESELVMSLIIDGTRDNSRESISAMYSQIERHLGYGSNLFFLGSGRICPYCGDYNPAGMLKCRRCEGITKEEKFISVKEFPFMLTSYTMHGGINDIAIIELDWIGTGEITTDIVETLTSADTRLESAPYSYSLQGYYLCEWCGQSVEDGKICPNCGGTRLPFSELMKIDHECLYCGRKVYGSIVCSGCAATLVGITYRELKGMRQ